MTIRAKPRKIPAQMQVITSRRLSHAALMLALLAFALPLRHSPLLAAPSPEPHWAFQPFARPAPPPVQLTSWPQSGLDQFILARLEAAKLQPAPRATREQYIRRVSFNLIGLPPTPAEIDEYLGDGAGGADARLLDRLLNSPHYGERWGRHWLDLARFGETDGFEHDAVRPNAWRYRDYVIQSFNEDKPYDRFVKEQIAGDLLYPGNPAALAATGFNLLGPDMVDSSDQIQRRHNTLNDMTDTSGLVFLGLTVGCARCHDHKQEPISQTDYFRLQAFYTPGEFNRSIEIATPEERTRHHEALQRHTEAGKPIEQEIQRLKAPYLQALLNRKLAALDEADRAAHATQEAERTAEQVKRVRATEKRLAPNDEELLPIMSAPDRKTLKSLQSQLEQLPSPPPLPTAMGLTEGKPASTFVLFRGEYNQPLEEVEPGFLTSLPPQPPPARTRAALAQWIASKDNPLTARVMVNRIWQQHFGQGIVATPSGFGLQGTPPSHPGLLNWLAHEFIESGWSIKAMHKLILLSATYQQSSHPHPNTLLHDPENLLLSHRTRVRLDGEAIRDALLSISGTLNPAMGGPGVFPPIPEDLFKGAQGWKTSPNAADHHRRSIYIFVRRNLRFPFLEVFDAPDSNLSCPERNRSTSAPQSLTLLNAATVIDAARATTARVEAATTGTEERVRLLHRLTLGRNPTPFELQSSLRFLEDSPLTELTRALFNLNAFVYLD